MNTLHNVASQMRENAIHLTSPAPAQPGPPMVIVRGHMASASDSYFEPWMELAFEGLTHASQTGDPYALIACFMNGQPAAIIAATEQRGGGTFILPLFVAVQPGMKFSQDGEPEADDEAA